MRPKAGIIYKMKASCYKDLPGHAEMLRHIHLCGNKFEYKVVSRSYTNMECKGCGWRFLTMTDTFGERYNKVESIPEAKDPNFLFNKYKRGVKQVISGGNKRDA